MPQYSTCHVLVSYLLLLSCVTVAPEEYRFASRYRYATAPPGKRRNIKSLDLILYYYIYQILTSYSGNALFASVVRSLDIVLLSLNRDIIKLKFSNTFILY